MIAAQALIRTCVKLLAITVAGVCPAYTGFAAAEERSADDYRIYGLTCSQRDELALLFLHKTFLQIDQTSVESGLTEFVAPGTGGADLRCSRSDEPIDVASAAETARVDQSLIIAVVPGYVARSREVPGLQIDSVWDLFMEPQLPLLEIANDGSIDVKEGPPPPDIVFESNHIAETWSPIAFLFQTDAMTCGETVGTYQAGTALLVSAQTCSVESQSASNVGFKLIAQNIETVNLCRAREKVSESPTPSISCHDALVPALRRQIAREVANWLETR